MKLFYTLFLLLIISCTYAQDIIIKKNGYKFECIVYNIDTSSIYFGITQGNNTLDMSYKLKDISSYTKRGKTYFISEIDTTIPKKTVSETSYKDIKYQRGFLYLKNGDTIPCKIKVYRPDIFIFQIKITNPHNNIKYSIKNENYKIPIDSIEFLKVGKINYVRVPNPYHNNYFAGLFIDGEIKLYKHFSISNGYYNASTGGITGGGLSTTYHLSVNNEQLLIKPLSFKKDCKQLFKANPLVIEKINNKEFKYRNIEEMVHFANSL